MGGVLDHPVRPAEPENPGRAGDVVSALRREPLGRDLLLNVRVDVGASTLWSESRAVQTLDNLFDRQVITPAQYLSRLPRGSVPNLAALPGIEQGE